MDKVDLSGLSQEDIEIVREVVEALKARAAQRADVSVGESVEFHSWPIGVKRKITREEIHDYHL